jgi:hypothetical protein
MIYRPPGIIMDLTYIGMAHSLDGIALTCRIFGSHIEITPPVDRLVVII